MKGPIDACMHVSSAEQIETFSHPNVIIAARRGEKSPSCLSMYTSVLSLHQAHPKGGCSMCDAHGPMRWGGP
jgi:hypothetical protein